MVSNRGRQGFGRIVPAFYKKLLSVLSVVALTHAHFIHIDHNEFRVSGFPRPPLPPPLPPADQLPHYLTARELSPAELMVDLSNALTYRILHYHSILNRNNFAFSPTALMSVLVALYEGSAGRSAIELRNVLQLPNNRDIVRVGYRDVHRRLRTYFFGSENPLKGLSLNKENVTITRDYETILMFYGYDLGMDMVSSTMAPTTTTTTERTTTETMEDTMATTTLSPAKTTVSEANINSETTEPSAENAISTTPTTVTTTTASTTTTAASIITTTASITTTEKPTEPEATTTEEMTTTTEAVITEEDTTETQPTTVKENTTPTTEESAATTTAIPPPTAEENDAAELITPQTGEPSTNSALRLQKSRLPYLPSAKLQAPPNTVQTPRLNYLPQQQMRNSSRAMRMSRHKRHLLGLKELDANLFVTLFSPQQQTHQSVVTISQSAAGPTNEYEVENLDTHFLNAASAKANYGYNTDVISHVFYLGNQELVHTTFKVYNAVLYFKYFDNLRMNVLELELDTPEYNLMILLPDYQMDLVSAAAALRIAPSLRLIRKQLKPRWVQAIIPDFKLHGLMFLTNDLQNMGICDIFEPNRADFRPMTDEKGIYVKHIEQSINVNIRTHPINQLKRNYGSQTQPIQISVNHPFLFFVIDRDLDVAVMAGRILNPLNVRIQ